MILTTRKTQAIMLAIHGDVTIGASEESSPLGLDPLFLSLRLSPTVADLYRNPNWENCVANVDMIRYGDKDASERTHKYRRLGAISSHCARRESIPSPIRLTYDLQIRIGPVRTKQQERQAGRPLFAMRFFAGSG